MTTASPRPVNGARTDGVAPPMKNGARTDGVGPARFVSSMSESKGREEITHRWHGPGLKGNHWPPTHSKGSSSRSSPPPQKEQGARAPPLKRSKEPRLLLEERSEVSPPQRPRRSLGSLWERDAESPLLKRGEKPELFP